MVGLLRPRFDNPEYHNDFAIWSRYALNDLVLAPEGALVRKEVEAFSEEDPDIHILELAADAHRTIHAVQHVPPTWYSRSLSARASG